MAQNGSLYELTDLRRGLLLDISPELTGTINRAANESNWDANESNIEIQDMGVPVDTVAYTGTDRLLNLGGWTFFNTPQLNTFLGSLFLVAGRDDNFFEWARVDIYFLTLSLNGNPTDKFVDELRDNSRTDDTILTLDRDSGEFNRFRNLKRVSDGFFVKLSYLFRM